MTSKDSGITPVRRWFKFSLRTLMILVFVAGSFLGGWVTNEMRHRYIIKDDAKIEIIEGTNIMVIRGTKEDVEALTETVESKSQSDGQH